ncbi:uncharacterized protein LOC113321613 [Papaver somniferum]|uniref:uncharacterized protein LOC113321613 n=1 Tax=Papaver somniferum TaxID=3469 RepID=UPI000E6FF141|nr:uncharacterized protein LOC113321613 [Papaver somniferum]XP_026425297.1 uncharacterized protein LOC113321613 [Papaver somniferum]
MTLWEFSDELMCKMFPQTLTDGAIIWFNQLKSRPIGTYEKLVEIFCEHYNYNRQGRKNSHSLFMLHQRKGGGIRQFLQRFKQELAEVVDESDETAIEAFRQAFPWDLNGMYNSLTRKPAKNLEELYDRAEEYARVADDQKAREARDVDITACNSQSKGGGKKSKLKNHPKGQPNERTEAGEKTPKQEKKLTPPNIGLSELYEKIKRELKTPRPLPADTRDKRDKNKYCAYQKDIGHTADSCGALQFEVQGLIDNGLLQEYVKKELHPTQVNLALSRVINVSHARINSIARRASVDASKIKLRQIKEWYIVNNIDFANGHGAETLEVGCKKIEFTEEDMKGIYYPHNDAVVISAWIGMFRVHRVLADSGSSVSVIFSGAYSSMNLSHDLIEEDGNPIIGLAGK